MTKTEIEQIIDRNTLLIKVVWGTFLLGILAHLLADSALEEIIVYLVTGFIPIMLVSFFIYKKIFQKYISYMIVILLGLISYSVLIYSNSIINYLILSLTYVIIAFYFDYKPLLLNTVINLFIANTIKLPNMDTVSAFVLNFYLILFPIILIAQSKIGKNMQNELKNKNINMMDINEKNQKLIFKVHKTIELLTEVSNNVKENISQTRYISDNLTKSFTEVASGSEAPSKLIFLHLMRQ